MAKASVEQYINATRLLEKCQVRYRVLIGTKENSVGSYATTDTRAVVADLICQLDALKSERQDLKCRLYRIAKTAAK